MLKYGLFGQASMTLRGDRLRLSLGVRTDANSWASSMSNPVEQISPRISAE